jgi:hypothetical protein
VLEIAKVPNIAPTAHTIKVAIIIGLNRAFEIEVIKKKLTTETMTIINQMKFLIVSIL